jgi:Zn-dependent protease with chaperone function
MTPRKELNCPNCRTLTPVNPGYTTWCDQCGWNISPHKPEPPRNIFEALYTSTGKKQGEALFNEMIKSGPARPSFTLPTALALGLAVFVHGLTLIFAILGGILLLRGWPNPVALVGGLLCLGLVWLLFPRLPQLREMVASRDEYPMLYKLADRIANALGTSPVDGLVINWQFNAAFAQVGWRRKKIVYLGLPLFSVLNDQEKIALLAHELAHGVNGDPSRSFFIGTAINALATWYHLIRPDRLYNPNSGIYALFTIPLNLFLLTFAALPWSGAYLLSHLLWRASQQAEYRADSLAAQISGSEAMLSLLTKLHLARDFEQKVTAISLNQGHQNLFDELKQLVLNMPLRELERIRRVEQLEESQLDTTHPPTAHRAAFLRAHPVNEAKATLTPEDANQMEQELVPMQGTIQQQLMDLHKRSLYY